MKTSRAIESPEAIKYLNYAVSKIVNSPKSCLLDNYCFVALYKLRNYEWPNELIETIITTAINSSDWRIRVTGMDRAFHSIQRKKEAPSDIDAKIDVIKYLITRVEGAYRRKL